MWRHGPYQAHGQDSGERQEHHFAVSLEENSVECPTLSALCFTTTPKGILMPHNTSHRTDQAPIVHRSETEISFRVDDVEPCRERLPFTNARQQLEQRLGRSLQTFTHDQVSDIVLGEDGIEHSLVHAIYLAFSQHRPLVLTPDAVWITLAQGFAHHINNHAESLRSRMVAHKGKVTVETTAPDLGTTEAWAEVIAQWSAGIEPQIPAELSRLILCDFSTTTPIIRTASQIVMLDAFQQYFDYYLMFICGIPTVTVRGSVEDWLAIRKRVDVMAGYHLEWWTDRITPICDGFVATVQGHPSQTFWKHIFSPKEVYGGTLITGWLADLFPYIKDSVTKAPTVRNPNLAIPREQLTSERGLSPKSVPTGLSCAPFTLKSGSDQSPKEMELVAGFIGVKQHADTGKLEPEIGWAVLEEDELARAMTLLASCASTSHDEMNPCAEPESSKKYAHIEDTGMPKECVQIVERYPQGQVFFGDTTHPWSLKPRSGLMLRKVSSDNREIFLPAVHVMDLADGRAIAYVMFPAHLSERPSWWVIVGKPDGQEFQRDSVTVIGNGFLQFLQRLTDSDGRYYFDEPDFQPDIVL
jgi:hypothetical protein